MLPGRTILLDFISPNLNRTPATLLSGITGRTNWASSPILPKLQAVSWSVPGHPSHVRPDRTSLGDAIVRIGCGYREEM